MKPIFFYILFLLVYFSGRAQNDFVGIAKYKITVEGGSNSVTDSMSIIFGKQKMKVILYVPGSGADISEKVFIDDFNAKKSMALNTETTAYKVDTLNTTAKYNFVNTQKVVAGSNHLLCFQYTAERNSIDTSRILSADCFAGIDYRNSFISNYSFLGIQPIIVDHRIVMDFIITQADGVKQKIYIFDIKRMEDVESYFNLSGYNQAQ